MDRSSIPIIAGVVGGIVVVNLILFATWYHLKRRRSKAPSRLYLSYEHERERTSSSYSTLPKHSYMTPLQNGERKSIVVANPPPSSRPNVLSKSPERGNEGLPPTNPEKILASVNPRPGKEKLRPPPLRPLTHPNVNAVAVNEQPKFGSLKRAFSVRSADSASLYSVASASPTVHERAFRPWTLYTIPASPTSPTTPPSAKLPSSRRTNIISTIQEALAPETYNKLRIEDKLTQGRRISGNIPAAMTLNLHSPVSPISPISPPPSAVFASSASQQHLLPTPTSPTDSIASKSALRNVRSQWIDS